MGGVIIDCAVYRQGERVDEPTHRADVLAARQATSRDGGFLWLGLHEPDNAELQAYADVLDLHPLAVEDAVSAHQRPKMERYGGGLFIVLKTLEYAGDDDVETGEVAIFVGSDYLVTVRHGRGRGLEDLRRRAEQRTDTLGHGPVAGLYAVMDGIVDRYADVATELQLDVDQLEHSVFSDERTPDTERIYRLKREVQETRRAVQPLREPLMRFVTDDVDEVGEDAIPFFRDVADHVARVSEAVESLDHLLDNVLSAHLARLAVQQNEDVRKISAWGALFLAPTLIASIYGMNFDQMPELSWMYGYPLALALMAVVSYALWRLFKGSGWL
ncbi:MAG: magnesium/cobalt transporter CorA [Nocardioidaceae bacterium]|nr:magnesium/cobalt transporter CorA [Nocardioidaceae bacterium]MDQ3450422.1 magnesium/cobalt transporter CorA [Actinomycetota bacterium]